MGLMYITFPKQGKVLTVEMSGPSCHEFVPSLKQRIGGLDEIRGIAILLVLLCHGVHLLFGTGRFNAWGYFGVNTFFVISGYLICTILKTTRERRDFFKTFYVRRIFRIWPLFLVVLGIGTFLGLALNSPVWKALPSYLTFTMNFPLGGVIPGTDPMWSLAIEEQFYLFLPILVYVMNPNRLPSVIAAICMLSAVGSTLLLRWTFEGNAVFAYPNFTNTGLRIHYIGFGVLLALQPRLAFGVIAGWAGASILFFHGAGVLESAIALLLVSGIYFTTNHKPLIRSPWLAKVGFVCYGLYLIHWPILRVLQKFLLPRVGGSVFGVTVVFMFFLGMSFIAAHFSFKYFENPIQKLRVRFERPLRGLKCDVQ
jgi:peptidoglycan/LPS O-acetylase OafA/YrhL